METFAERHRHISFLSALLLLAVAIAGCSTANNAGLRRPAATNATIPVGHLPIGIAVGDGSVWVANYRDGTVSRIDPQSRSVAATIRVGVHPKGIAVGADGSVWVILYDEGRVARIDPKTNTVAQVLPVGSSYVGIGEGAVWVTNEDEDTLSRIDPGSGRVTATVPVGHWPVGIAAGEGAVWVANYDDATVRRIDPKTNQVVGDSIAVGRRPGNIATGEGAVWVSNYDGNTVSRIDPSTQQGGRNDQGRLSPHGDHRRQWRCLGRKL